MPVRKRRIPSCGSAGVATPTARTLRNTKNPNLIQSAFVRNKQLVGRSRRAFQEVRDGHSGQA